MDKYGLSTPDYFRIDDLLDFSNDEIFSPSAISSTTTTTTDHLPPPQNQSATFNPTTLSTDFTDDLCVPSDDVAELEWLSQFVDDSFSDFPANSLTGTLTVRSDTSFTGRARTKRTKAMNNNRWTSETPATGKSKPKRENQRESSPTPEGGVRRCTHCASEKTPQWRTGPLGPKTLCNACGVRYKSGRLVPEYRPAASPTFVLTQHSNSHRKVMELRRQKEVSSSSQLQQQQEQIMYRHHNDFEVC